MVPPQSEPVEQATLPVDVDDPEGQPEIISDGGRRETEQRTLDCWLETS